MTIDYQIRRVGAPFDARVYMGKERVGEVMKGEGVNYVLVSERDGRWVLSPKVHGEVRPFSMSVKRLAAGEPDRSGRTVLTIRNHLFQHRGKYYMLMGTPEGRPLREILRGRRYICRLDNLQLDDIADIDHETRSTLHKLRGVPVGELEGLGTAGHKVMLSEELVDIGLPLAVCSYLLYSSA